MTEKLYKHSEDYVSQIFFSICYHWNCKDLPRLAPFYDLRFNTPNTLDEKYTGEKAINITKDSFPVFIPYVSITAPLKAQNHLNSNGHAWVRVWFSVVEISWNALKFPERMCFPNILCMAEFPQNKKFLAKFPTIRKVLKLTSLMCEGCKLKTIYRMSGEGYFGHNDVHKINQIWKLKSN